MALLGGQLKSRQMLSGNMADILSNIYMSQSLLDGIQNGLVDGLSDPKLAPINNMAITYLCNEAERKMNYVIANYPNRVIRWLLAPLGYRERQLTVAQINELYENIISNPMVSQVLKSDMYLADPESVVAKLERLHAITDRSSPEYKKIYDNVVSVGEYRIR